MSLLWESPAPPKADPHGDIDTIDGRIKQLVNRWVLPEHRDVAQREIYELLAHASNHPQTTE